ADICTDSGHCQAFADISEFEKKYGEKGTAIFENAQNAANATKGLILLYDNMPIVAVFHASSGDSTASSKEVWGGDLAYLVSVETSEIIDGELKDQVINEITFTRQELLNKFSNAGIEGLETYKDSPFHLWISGKELTESGRVKSINIAGTKISGTKLRSILGLKSADFEISFGDDSVTFITKGYGHGVGMSQLGAVAMAKNGESFYSILSKYYPGTVIGII
ncbi:MAG: SpoIID/LytB domain-containing protein, partial [Clostridia bacterium]|nr:SpoIID/LytB domain-containing protein [Clostridia bacterium]